MSYCRKEEDGKDILIFLEKEDASEKVITDAVGEQQPIAQESGESAIGPDGEINWDCPCLGGMANGPCGEKFKAAFSCFVYSTAEPKGIDCVDNFRAMQDCFREYPEVYADEIADDEAEDATPGEELVEKKVEETAKEELETKA
ncbi:uncharacterized protein VTP21DRAFT_7298 [Calcarisporiella thermophila]|uniref:uncharacterized protein n=1 Tax=Calcarisporiella thermophila TaxID=911321 RepID=UPI0037429D1F